MDRKVFVFVLHLLLGINYMYSQASGTGFLISTDGYIITCYHVIENSIEVKVKGINGNFTTEYVAEIVSQDIQNDLAILKINGNVDHTPSYGIKWDVSEVGEDVFTLGYPLKTTMGDEIKLTNGIISAKSGFQGNISNYQISVPVQPGNSGGPLFDKSGSVIGVINAKHSGTDNVSYAIKSSVLKNLIDSYSNKINYKTISSISNEPLTEKVKAIKKDILIIETINNLQSDEIPLVIFTKSKAKIKSKPDELAAAITSVEPDTKLEAIGKVGDYWEIFFNGDIAYVHDLYIKESETTSYIKYSLPEKYKSIAVEAITKTVAKMKYEPSPTSNIKFNIPKNETIYVIGYYDDYWRVFYKGEEGYLMDGLYFENTYKMMKFKKP